MSTTPVTRDYTSDFVAALAELARMEEERNILDTKIAKQKKRVAALHELANSEDDAPAPTGLVEGLTDACRIVFRAAEKPLLPIEVRDRVQALGLPPQNNLLASVHTVIRRLKESREIVEEFHLQPGGSAPATYRWAEFKPRYGFPDPLNKSKIIGQRLAERGQELGTSSEGHPVRFAQDHDKKK